MGKSKPGFGVGKALGGPAREAPRVDLDLTLMGIAWITFFKPAGLGHFLYEESSAHDSLPGKDLQGWGRGPKIEGLEYLRSGKRSHNHPACFTRASPLSIVFGLLAFAQEAVDVEITAVPLVDGDSDVLKPATVSVRLEPDRATHGAHLDFEGLLPNDVGEHLLQIKWTCGTSGFSFGIGAEAVAAEETKHTVFTIRRPPIRPDYFDENILENPGSTTHQEGTLSGTRKRMSHLMSLLSENGRGGPPAHRADTDTDLEDIWWRVHVGINDTAGQAPFFNGRHDAFIRPKGPGKEPHLPFEDQWLMWLETAKGDHWNDAACIGHVQLAKTMLAAVGIPVKRAWVFPYTDHLPNKVRLTIKDTDVYVVEKFDRKRRQEHTLKSRSGALKQAHAVLIEPGAAKADWEEFEACQITKAGKFLTGGYALDSMPADFRKNRGFRSAIKLLQWWTNTKRGSFRRFMCWAFHKPPALYYWDVDGNLYEPKDFEKIRARGKNLPPPALPKPVE